MDKIAVPLSKSQRDLLIEHQTEFSDLDLTRVLSLALKKDNGYEIYLTNDQLNDLGEELCAISNYTKTQKAQRKLDKLCDHIEEYIPDFDLDDEGVDEYSECSKNTGSVYILKVALEHDKKIWRKIAIRSGQTLHDLHDIIYDAFDRDDEHLYSFYFPTIPAKSRSRKAMRDATEYTHPFALEESGIFESEASNAAMTSIQSLNLQKKQKFYYLFDFGDSWWHEITVEEIDGNADEGTYPRIIEKKGQSPPQYQYEDEEDEDEEWDESEDNTE